MGFLLTGSVALEASKGPRWVCRGPLGLGSAENSGLECNYDRTTRVTCAVVDGHRGCGCWGRVEVEEGGSGGS